MLLSFLSDIKNFAVGSVSGSVSRTGRWGGWALGFRGEHTEAGQFKQFHIGGLLAPALVVGLLSAPFGGAGIVAAAYVSGVIGAAALGAVTGFIAGGFNEVAEGWAARREWKAQMAQQRDQSKLEGLQSKLEQAQEKANKIHHKIEKISDRMHTRASDGNQQNGHAAREMQRRAGTAENELGM